MSNEKQMREALQAVIASHELGMKELGERMRASNLTSLRVDGQAVIDAFAAIEMARQALALPTASPAAAPAPTCKDSLKVAHAPAVQEQFSLPCYVSLSTKNEMPPEGDYDCDKTVSLLAKRLPAPAVPQINYHPGTWYEAKSREELEAFFLSRLPAIREAAREHGYAIGLHGSLRRDMDLIAVPWRDGASDKDKLAHAIAMAAVGITRDGGYQWEIKPAGRVATSLPCAWTTWHGEAGAGHIDLSVIPAAPSQEPAAPIGLPQGITTSQDDGKWRVTLAFDSRLDAEALRAYMDANGVPTVNFVSQPSQEPVTLTDFDAIPDEVIDAAQEQSGMYRVELMRAWDAIIAALREKGALR